MPRVNRDLQRRLAARRERERRRPAPERRYRFQTAEPAESEVEPEEERADGATQSVVAEPAGARSGRARREGRATHIERPAPRPFSSYAQEYAYVLTDLRRLGLVVGSIVVVLILLYFVLPH